MFGDRGLEGTLVRTEWEPDELISSWTLVEGNWKLIKNKAGATRLGFALMLKFYETEGRFPTCREEVPQAAVDYVASLVKVDAGLFGKYSWAGRTIKTHRKQIREAFGTRPSTEEDEERWARWMADDLCSTETNRDRLAEEHRRHPAVRPQHEPGAVAEAGEVAEESADRLGPDRPQLRPDDQVRDRAQVAGERG